MLRTGHGYYCVRVFLFDVHGKTQVWTNFTLTSSIHTTFNYHYLSLIGGGKATQSHDKFHSTCNWYKGYVIFFANSQPSTVQQAHYLPSSPHNIFIVRVNDPCRCIYRRIARVWCIRRTTGGDFLRDILCFVEVMLRPWLDFRCMSDRQDARRYNRRGVAVGQQE